MLEKGTMRPGKKIIGAALILMAVGFMFDVAQIKDVILNNQVVSSVVMLAGGYFLFISGRQR